MSEIKKIIQELDKRGIRFYHWDDIFIHYTTKEIEKLKGEFNVGNN